MVIRIFLLLFLCALVMPPPAEARDAKVVREFKRMEPCPATGKRRGNCPGYHADHIIALCAGGADHWANMQWLTVPEHKVKTREDVKACAAHRRERSIKSGAGSTARLWPQHEYALPSLICTLRTRPDRVGSDVCTADSASH